MISQTAQGLASLGRNGDSMLVHMSPEEVGGLQQIGNSLGIKMSTNPQTGMPEAFSFGDFFTSFLPTIVGAAVGGPAGGGLMSSMTPILAGAGTGALLAAAKGDDPLMGGLTGGFGGYGGSQLGQSISGAFGKGTTAGSMDDLISAGTKNLNPAVGQSGIVGPTGQLGPDMGFGVAGKQGADLTTQALPNFAAGPNFTTTAPLSPTAQAAQNLGDLGSGVKNLTGFGDMSIGDAYGKFTQAGGTAGQLAMPVGGAVLAGLEPSDLGYGTGNLYEDPDKGKYRGPMGQLNLSDRFDTGLRLATGGTIQSGGIRDLYGTPDNQPTISPGLSGFGLGRLNNLAGEQAMTQAQTLGYADGGGVVAGEKGMNLDNLPSLNLNIVSKPSESDSGYDYSPDRDIFNLFGNRNKTPSVQAEMSGRDDMGWMDRFLNKTNRKVNEFYGSIGDGSLLDGYYRMQENFGGGAGNSATAPAQPTSYGLNLNSGQQQAQYARGGYLNGDGDGMSDSIPATIEGKQPARLADGEFVIPADVVSHLGNGSSKAGSKRLYAMLDKVRQARTGNKKQGKEIKAEKYLPA